MRVVEEAILPERTAPPVVEVPKPVASRMPATRFTSNIVGPITFLADLLCILISAPAAYFAYRYIIGQGAILSVHLFALAIMAASFFLLRSSRRAYRRIHRAG